MLTPAREQIEIFVDALFRHAGKGFVSLRSFYEGDINKPKNLKSRRRLGALGAILARLRSYAEGLAANDAARLLHHMGKLVRQQGIRRLAGRQADGGAVRIGAGADPRSERRRSKLPNPRRPAVAAARRAADEAIVFVSPNGNRSKQYQGRFS